jgi:gliding motility-associated-like protein
MKLKLYLLLFILTALSLNNFATHIVGGEIYYDCLGNNNYKITLKIYRDCCPTCAQFDSPAPYIGIFDNAGTLIDSLNMGAPIITPLQNTIVNPCFTFPNNVCVEEGDYVQTVNLPPIPGGYTLTYQRCCRNSAILNIANASNVGSTYTIQILPNSVVSCNSSPRYTYFPPLFVCEGMPLTFNNSATDPDGDVLVYSLCDAYDGASTALPQPNPPMPPPYPFVLYNPPYTGTYPMSSSPIFTINSNTGLLTGTPNMIGRWVVGICCQEYRNGVLLTTNKRDFQFNVVNCPIVSVASIPVQSSFCFGMTDNFTQNSINAFSYHWDFGNPNSNTDTANTVSPSYTYPDTGTYHVTLIINQGTQCSDTNTVTVEIQNLLAPSFTPPPGQCVNDNHFNFTAAGAFTGNGTFNWAFGPHANPSISNQQNPSNIVFDTVGTFPVSITINENGCTQTYTNNITVYPKPDANFSLLSSVACAMNPVQFSDSSAADTPLSYIWNFGNETSSTSQNPSAYYNSTGNYNVTLIITTQHGCKDTVSMLTPIAVYPLPQAGFKVSPKDTSIFYPQVTLVDQSISAVTCDLDWGDGNTTTDCNNVHSYAQPGVYTITQIVSNIYGCLDTSYQTVIIRPETRFWIPDAFTPGEDGINDVFKPVVIGVHNYKFYIFNRWGEELFFTSDINAGWNGTYKGNPAASDVFVYKVSFSDDVDDETHSYIGSVTLVR